MIIPYTRWPEELAARYREKGYWLDEPLNDILQRHAENDAVALTDGDRTLTYRELEQAAHRLAVYAVAIPRWCNWATWRNSISPSLRC